MARRSGGRPAKAKAAKTSEKSGAMSPTPAAPAGSGRAGRGVLMARLGEQAADHRLERRERHRVIVGIERDLVPLVAELRRGGKAGVAAIGFAPVAIEAEPKAASADPDRSVIKKRNQTRRAKERRRQAQRTRQAAAQRSPADPFSQPTITRSR